MPKLSVTIITRNEASNIAGVIDSAAWADEIIVVDAESTDDTVSLAESRTSRVVVRAWPGFGAQKNYAADIAEHDWILSLDADERVTPTLAHEIRALLENEPPARGYRLRRVTHHLGRWIRSTDWYQDDQLRLYDRRVGRWNDRLVHESVEVAGPVARLASELQHFPYRNLKHHLDTINQYTSLAAMQMAASGRRAGVFDLLLQAPMAFGRNYVLRRGIGDGIPGLLVSALNSYYVFVKFAKLWELQRQSREGGS